MLVKVKSQAEAMGFALAPSATKALHFHIPGLEHASSVWMIGLKYYSQLWAARAQIAVGGVEDQLGVLEVDLPLRCQHLLVALATAHNAATTDANATGSLSINVLHLKWDRGNMHTATIVDISSTDVDLDSDSIRCRRRHGSNSSFR
eukprot:6692662-Lingulodinium_polyedra.AAC.1